MSKETKEEFLNSLEKETDKEFYKKYYSDIIKIDDYFLPFKRKEIKKSFCFAAGYNGVCADDDMKNANNMAEHARKSEQYFLNRNLEELNEDINILKYLLIKDDFETWEQEQEYRHKNNIDYRYYMKDFYLIKNNNEKELYYTFLDAEQIKDSDYYTRAILRKANKNDMQAILTALEAEKEAFTKRLKTYLKRYGLSKVNSWSYISD